MTSNDRWNDYIARQNTKELRRMEKHAHWQAFIDARQKTLKSRAQASVRKNWHCIFICSELFYLGAVCYFTTSMFIAVSAMLLGAIIFAGLALHMDQ